MDDIGRHINAAIEAEPDDEVELQFHQSLIFGQDKLHEYSLMKTHDTPFYYAAVILYFDL